MTELVFKGKEFVWNHHLAVPFRPLVMQPEKGIGDPRLHGNQIVRGDNSWNGSRNKGLPSSTSSPVNFSRTPKLSTTIAR